MSNDDRQQLEEHLETLHSWYIEGFPEKPESRALRKIGYEAERPVIDITMREAADSRGIFGILGREGWYKCMDDVNNDLIVGVIENHHILRQKNVGVTTDASASILEINIPPESDLFRARTRLEVTERKIANLLGRHLELHMLGYGIQPRTSFNDLSWVARGRYDVLTRSLPFGINQILSTASDQVHLDLYRDEIIRAVNVFNALTWVIIRLFANSPIHRARIDSSGRLAVREQAWDFAPERSGVPNTPFESVEDFLLRMVNLEHFLVKVPGGYVIGDRRSPFKDTVVSKEAWINQYPFLEGTVWHNARARRSTATIEIRSACAQNNNANLGGTSALGAFCMGIMENLSDAEAIVREFTWGACVEAKGLTIQNKLSTAHNLIAFEVLQCAKKGLKTRRQNEEYLLEPVWTRLEEKTNPALEAVKLLRSGGWDAFINSISL